MAQSSTTLLKNLDDVAAFAHVLWQEIMPHDVIALYGDLGVGKTTLARALIQAATGQDLFVASPTFTLMQPYATPKGPLVHADFYRLKALDELEEIGFYDLIGRVILLIEWPEKIENALPARRLDIVLEIVQNEGREVRILDQRS